MLYTIKQEYLQDIEQSVKVGKNYYVGSVLSLTVDECSAILANKDLFFTAGIPITGNFQYARRVNLPNGYVIASIHPDMLQPITIPYNNYNNYELTKNYHLYTDVPKSDRIKLIRKALEQGYTIQPYSDLTVLELIKDTLTITELK